MNGLARSVNNKAPTSRRDFIKRGGSLAVGAALAGAAVPRVHAAEDNTIRLALIGSGPRGCGAAVNAFEAPGGPVKLTAMADVFEDRLTTSHDALKKQYPDHVDVPQDRRFLGFDAYRKAIDCLRPGDVAMLTTRAAFRPVHFEYAVAKGVNVFMEKSFATDPVGVRRLLKAAEQSEKKGLKVASGLMCRHSKNRQELIDRIRDGALGQILLLRAYRMEHFGELGRKPDGMSELTWQLRRSIYHLYWLSAGLWSEADIHQIDEMCWIKDAWPVAAHGVGGRMTGVDDRGQNLHSYAAEWTFADGTKAHYVLRNNRPGCHPEFATYAHGAKRAAQFSGNIHAGNCQIFNDQRMERDNVAWRAARKESAPWQEEWNVLIDAIRNDRPHNEARRAALATVADFMGRAAVHSGKIVTWDDVMNSNFQWCPNLEQLDLDSEPPVRADQQGGYPVPVPGAWTEL